MRFAESADLENLVELAFPIDPTLSKSIVRKEIDLLIQNEKWGRILVAYWANDAEKRPIGMLHYCYEISLERGGRIYWV